MVLVLILSIVAAAAWYLLLNPRPSPSQPRRTNVASDQLLAAIDQADLLDLIDVSVTSARAGSRKPHPGIYDVTLSALGVDPEDVVFVGDSWEPDVRGPRRIGMTAAHVWREEERSGLRPPELEAGDHRVGDLTGVLEVIDGLRLVTNE